MKTKVVRISRELPGWKPISTAASIIDSGGLICFPTDTTYGFAASIYSHQAIERLRKLKARGKGQPFVIIVSDMGMVQELARRITPKHRRLIELYWPGPLTLVFEASKRVPPYIVSEEGTIALRIPNDTLTQALLRACGIPLAAPSANSKGKRPAISAEEVLGYFRGKVELVLDGGMLESPEPSTIVAVSASRLHILRKGRLALGGQTI